MKGFGIGFIVVLLMGCTHAPSQLADGQIDGYAVGAGLRLNHAIEIPPDSATVRLQFGHVVARNAVQEQEPHCIFELDTVKPEVQVVAPERLRIVSVRRREQTFSGMPVLPGYGGLFRHDDRPSHIYFMTEFRLKSATQPQIRSMTCQHNQASAGVTFMRHLSLSEIRSAMGSVFTLELGPHRDVF